MSGCFAQPNHGLLRRVRLIIVADLDRVVNVAMYFVRLELAHVNLDLTAVEWVVGFLQLC